MTELTTVAQLVEALDGLPADTPIAVGLPGHQGARYIAGLSASDDDIVLTLGDRYLFPPGTDPMAGYARILAQTAAETGWPFKMIRAIKELREHEPSLGLREAKDIVDELWVREAVVWAQETRTRSAFEIAARFGVAVTGRQMGRVMEQLGPQPAGEV